MNVTPLARLAGFFAAHGVWCIVDGETLIPLLARETADSARSLGRFEGEDGTTEAQQAFEASSPAERGVLVLDGYVTVGGEKLDALLIEARQSAPEPAAFSMAVPYRKAAGEAPFAVYKPKLLGVTPAEVDAAGLAEAFFGGVADHAQGSAVWDEHLDESR